MDSRPGRAARVADISPFHVMEVQTAARALEAAGRNVVHMEIGEPDFPTPQPVLDAARRALADGGIYYTSALGLPELREAIARHYAEHYGVQVDSGRVIVTAGSSAALLLVMALLVDRDRQILLADPGYPCNRHFVRVLEGEALALPVGPESRYQPTAALVERHWTAATCGVLIATPSNPTGTTVPADEMRRIAVAVDARGGHLIVDEIYLGLTYGERPRSVLAFADDAFVISSFSKYFNMTGWRLGWVVAPLRYVRDIEKLAQNLYISPPTLSQRAALACFEPATIDVVEQRRRAFQARRDFLVPALRQIGFGIPVLPNGGFFIYADCARFSDDSEAFCRDVLQGAGVAFTPGVDFGRHRARQHVRLAYTIDERKLEDGVARLARYLAR
ncbi:MAG: pyridoxal phosphate-dependent aminotransferase [Betaproteobacteria bacterium]|nr:pyridoxal phosphate-dependent aminotransferase [Betaproteobacteria bacterium]MDE2210110.1 pyridoxal phosphate-dependent aminotransferase [Betaproteobacteria bacterium]